LTDHQSGIKVLHVGNVLPVYYCTLGTTGYQRLTSTYQVLTSKTNVENTTI